jgi:hypothetical protein
MRFLVGAFESVTIPPPDVGDLGGFRVPSLAVRKPESFGYYGRAMIAYPLTTWIILHASWPVVFYVNALLGFVGGRVAVVCHRHPRRSPACNRQSVTILKRSFHQPRHLCPAGGVHQCALLVLSLSYMCFAYLGWMFLFWFPAYLVEGRGFPSEQWEP